MKTAIVILVLCSSLFGIEHPSELIAMKNNAEKFKKSLSKANTAQDAELRVFCALMTKVPALMFMCNNGVFAPGVDVWNKTIDSVCTGALGEKDVIALKDVVKRYYELSDRTGHKVTVQMLPIRANGLKFKFEMASANQINVFPIGQQKDVQRELQELLNGPPGGATQRPAPPLRIGQ